MQTRLLVASVSTVVALSVTTVACANGGSQKNDPPPSGSVLVWSTAYHLGDGPISLVQQCMKGKDTYKWANYAAKRFKNNKTAVVYQVSYKVNVKASARITSCRIVSAADKAVYQLLGQ